MTKVEFDLSKETTERLEKDLEVAKKNLALIETDLDYVLKYYGFEYFSKARQILTMSLEDEIADVTAELKKRTEKKGYLSLKK